MKTLDLTNTTTAEALSFYALQNGYDFSDCRTAAECRDRSAENEGLKAYYHGEDLGLNLPDHATLRDFFDAISPESLIFN